MSDKITSRAEDYSRWYTDIVLRAELADYGPVRGCMVIRPNGYAIWENIQATLDRMFKETGHVNAYFPLFMPKSFLDKEAEHVEGFAPECAVVTHAGGSELEEPIIVRPTSEAIIWNMYKRWISSYRDLPLLYNQWANVVRWEMRTRLFLRTTEFLWQEGHTAHATAEEALEECDRMLQVYRTFAEGSLAIPVICGRKTEHEKFAGAEHTYTLETMMQDGKALQFSTSHYLGDKFARAFEVQFQAQDGELRHPFATSWGSTTRMIGAMIMVHSDDQGLVIPPKIAPTQVVIVPIWRGEEEKTLLKTFCHNLVEKLKPRHSVRLDDREEVKPGRKFNEWELKGVPIRVEVGPRDLANQQIVLVRRDTGEKRAIPVQDAEQEISALLVAIQNNLFERARKHRDERTFTLDDYEEFKERIEAVNGFYLLHWCEGHECEKKISDETKATIRCIPFDSEPEFGHCIRCGQPSKQRYLFAKAY
jgi:prolyl-tRNA synthetase